MKIAPEISEALGFRAWFIAWLEPALDAHLRAIAQGQGLEYSPLNSARRNWSQQRWDSELQRSDAIPKLLRFLQQEMETGNPSPYSFIDAVNDTAEPLNIPFGTLPVLRSKWRWTGDPLYAWEAARFCTETKCAFPDWLTDYLAECAARMPRPGTKVDMRKKLPSALGFLAKRGTKKSFDRPGDARRRSEYMLLTQVFAFAIGQGCSPSQAVAEAVSLLGPDYVDRDQRTLLKLIARHYGFSEVPSSAVAWQRALLAITMTPERFGELLSKVFSGYRSAHGLPPLPPLPPL